MSLRVDLGPRSYDIVLTRDDSAGVGPFARTNCRASSALVIADESVADRARDIDDSLRTVGFRTSLAFRPPGEGQKSLAVAGELYEKLLDLPADRRTLVVAVGGGVIGDLAGFVASTYARGLPLLMIPTTLLAMVDSSVGGKVAVNLPRAKNMVGTFHQPIGVWIDIAALNTLPAREYRSGLAEVVKYGVILDAPFFAELEANADGLLERRSDLVERVVQRSCELKADVVQKDEREETGLRAALNYGHTFAHAFEAVAGYGSWLHGEAVAAGMVCASRLAERRGLIDATVTKRQIDLLERLGLPIRPEKWPIDELISVMRTDKKSVAGALRFILPTRLGAVALFDNVPEADVREILEEA
jgi:3-dehydroquinate synthase